MIDLIVVVVEIVITLVSTVIEALASLFTSGAGELILVLVCLIFEVIFWLLLLIKELLVSLFNRRRPQVVKKPVFWRPKKTPSEEPENQGK